MDDPLRSRQERVAVRARLPPLLLPERRRDMGAARGLSVPHHGGLSTQLTFGDTSSGSPASASDSGGIANPPAVTSISGGGRMMQHLEDLQDSDPAKFKQVVSDMAKKLRADAQNASGPDADRLSQIADRLDKVAASGDLSQLRPQARITAITVITAVAASRRSAVTCRVRSRTHSRMRTKRRQWQRRSHRLNRTPARLSGFGSAP